jgi:hypothetical protein
LTIDVKIRNGRERRNSDVVEGQEDKPQLPWSSKTTLAFLQLGGNIPSDRSRTNTVAASVPDGGRYAAIIWMRGRRIEEERNDDDPVNVDLRTNYSLL